MTGVSTSAGLWVAAKQLAGAQTKSRLLMLRSELQHTRKGTMKMSEYLSKLKSIADQLALAGSSIPLSDLIIQALAGLDGEYNVVVVQLSQQAETLTWIELQTSLLTFEARLEQLTQFANLSVSVNNLANFAKTDSGSSFRNNNPWRGGRGRGRRGRTFNARRISKEDGPPVCLLCTRVGHTVETCFHRFDRSFIPSSSRGRVSSNAGRRSSPFSESNSVYWATLEVVADDSWYMDSGATSHITNDLNKLDATNELAGPGNKGNPAVGKDK